MLLFRNTLRHAIDDKVMKRVSLRDSCMRRLLDVMHTHTYIGVMLAPPLMTTPLRHTAIKAESSLNLSALLPSSPPLLLLLCLSSDFYDDIFITIAPTHTLACMR